MKFTALPVNVGDSYLLRKDEKVILVDGGMNQKHILALLRKERIPNNHIDLLVCTHYDADHINGIIGILKSQTYSFKEIWLPEILGSIGYTLSKRTGEIFDKLRHNEFPFEEFTETDSLIINRYDNKEIPEDSLTNNSLEDIDNQILEDIGTDSFRWMAMDPWFRHFPYPARYHKVMLGIKSVASLVSMSLNSGSYIRWLKYQGKEIHRTYGFDMYCENAVQTDITIFDNRLFFMALHEVSLSKINQQSLVCMHRNENEPDILFTADSDLAFYSTKVKLKDNSVVTAPHHGSSANDVAYEKILGNNLTFVRSDRSQQARPGKGYLSNNARYCTICRNFTQKQKVELNYNEENGFSSNANKCQC